MQEGLLLVVQLKVQKEARSLNQVIPVVLSSALDNLTVILQLVSLQNITSDIVLKRIIIYRVLIVPVRLILERTHPF